MRGAGRAEEGDRVRKGQVLARLDDEGFRLDREAAAATVSLSFAAALLYLPLLLLLLR